MDIEGLKAVEQYDTGTGTVTRLFPENCGPRHLFIEVLSSGPALIELREGEEVPHEGVAESLHVETGHDLVLMERLIRALLLLHFDLYEARDVHTDVDVQLLSKGFEIGYEEDGSPIWALLSSAMNVVIRNVQETGIPASADEPLSMLCIIPGRSQVRFMCENLATAFKALDTKKAFKVAQTDDPTVMYNIEIVDRDTVVLH